MKILLPIQKINHIDIKMLRSHKTTDGPPIQALIVQNNVFKGPQIKIVTLNNVPTTTFSLITSANIGISSKNFLTLNCNLFITLVLNFKVIPSVSPRLLNLNQDPLKKIEFMTTSLIENAIVTKLWSNDHIYNII